MEKEYLIKKWLDHDLNAEELKAFKELEDYDALMTLSQSTQKFESSDYDIEDELSRVRNQLKTEKQTIRWMKPLLRIAAIATIALGSVWFFNKNSDTQVSTLASQKTTFDLPDASQVTLNASSNLVFNSHEWKNERHVNLEGEAFFDVTKGSKFDVITNEGTVTVLGTEFNVKQRLGYFEVVCYEGLVGVTYNNQPQKKLKPGQRFLVVDGKIISEGIETAIQPSWMHNESEFKSMPYKHVLSEFERQYNVSFNTEGVDLNQLFTGNFAHDNYHIAIKAITLPLHLTYSKTNNAITLMRE